MTSGVDDQSTWGMWVAEAKRFAKEARRQRVPMKDVVVKHVPGAGFSKDKSKPGWEVEVTYRSSEGIGELTLTATITKRGKLVELRRPGESVVPTNKAGREPFTDMERETIRSGLDSYASEHADRPRRPRT